MRICTRLWAFTYQYMSVNMPISDSGFWRIRHTCFMTGLRLSGGSEFKLFHIEIESLIPNVLRNHVQYNQDHLKREAKVCIITMPVTLCK